MVQATKEAVDEQFDPHETSEQRIDLSDAVEAGASFDGAALPYTLGAISAQGFGIVDIDYMKDIVVVAPVE